VTWTPVMGSTSAAESGGDNISPRTGQVKKAPRGRPFNRGDDPRRKDGSYAPSGFEAAKPEAAKPAPNVLEEDKVELHLSHFLSEATERRKNEVAAAFMATDPSTLGNLRKEIEQEATAKHAAHLERRRKQAELLAALEAKKAADAVKDGKFATSPAGAVAERFPLKELVFLGDGIEAAHAEGKIGVGYSVRRQVMTRKLWMTFVKEGLSPEDSFRLAFAMVASERATEDQRDFYAKLWHAKMGTKLYPLPVLPHPKDGQFWHPQAGVVIAVMRQGIPIWLHGGAGAGKTVLTNMASKYLGRPYHRTQGSKDRTLEEIVGGWGYNPERGTEFRYGAIALAMQAGAVLHIDEVSALPSEVTFEMHAVCEGQPLTLLRKSNETVEAKKGFALVANDNTVGEGENSSMVGTMPVNAAFRDRWCFLHIEPMAQALREKIIMAATL